MIRRTRSTPVQPKIEPKAIVAVARRAEVKAKAKAVAPSRTVPEPAPVPSPTKPKPPSGKLGALLGRIGTPAGASIDQLADATGWQAHTIRSAASVSFPALSSSARRLAGIRAQIGYKRCHGHYGGRPPLAVDNTLDRRFDADAPDKAQPSTSSARSAHRATSGIQPLAGRE